MGRRSSRSPAPEGPMSPSRYWGPTPGRAPSANGSRGWAGSRGASVWTSAGARGGDCSKQIRGADARKVGVSDRFKSYGWIKRRQYCWAHLDRDFQAMIDRGGEAAEVGRRLLGHSERLFGWWHRVRDGTMARGPAPGGGGVMRVSFPGG